MSTTRVSFDAESGEEVDKTTDLPTMKDDGGVRKRMSKASNAFDRGNKGYLDHEEQLLRKFNVKGDGDLSNSELFSMVAELNKQVNQKRSYKKGLFVAVGALLILIMSSFGLTLVAVNLSKEVSVDNSGQLVDGSGRVVETKSKALLIEGTPAEGVARRLLARELQAVITGESSNGDGALTDGRELLGTVPCDKTEDMYESQRRNSEPVNVAVVIEGVEYTRSLDLGRMSMRREERLGNGGENQGQSQGQGNNQGRGQGQGGGGGGRRRKRRFGGIRIKGDPSQQEFHVDETDDGICTVYSVGVYSRGRRNRQKDRKLQEITGDYCLPPNGGDGITCPERSDCVGDPGRCSCESGAQAECAFLDQIDFGLIGACFVDIPLNEKYFCKQVFPEEPCFSGDMLVETPIGQKRMDQVEVGDQVLTASGKYQKVYAFLHRLPGNLAAVLSPYLMITTESGHTIELTNRHMVYVNSLELPVPASKVVEGDSLYVLEPRQDKKEVKPVQVASVSNILRLGGYSPVTEDGTIVVNGLVASSYATPRYAAEMEYIEIGGKPLMHRASFTHWLLSPIRFHCVHVSETLCAEQPNGEAFLPFSNEVDALYQSVKGSRIEGAFMVFFALFGKFGQAMETAVSVVGMPSVRPFSNVFERVYGKENEKNLPEDTKLRLALLGFLGQGIELLISILIFLAAVMGAGYGAYVLLSRRCCKNGGKVAKV